MGAPTRSRGPSRVPRGTNRGGERGAEVYGGVGANETRAGGGVYSRAGGGGGKKPHTLEAASNKATPAYMESPYIDYVG